MVPRLVRGLWSEEIRVEKDKLVVRVASIYHGRNEPVRSVVPLLGYDHD